jgi:hypothetical protein
MYILKTLKYGLCIYISVSSDMSSSNVRNLTFAFFSPKPGDDWVNSLVARASKYPYCHLEIYFETINQCFSIQLGETAMLRSKNLSSDCYEIVTLAVSMKEYDSCLDFCRKAMQQKLTFDDRAMWSSYFLHPLCSCCCCCCFGASEHNKKTFCSKIICEALQHAGVPEVEHRHPACTTPSRLYSDIMHSKRRVVASVPYKREQMLKTKTITFLNNVYFRVDTAVP